MSLIPGLTDGSLDPPGVHRHVEIAVVYPRLLSRPRYVPKEGTLITYTTFATAHAVWQKSLEQYVFIGDYPVIVRKVFGAPPWQTVEPTSWDLPYGITMRIHPLEGEPSRRDSWEEHYWWACDLDPCPLQGATF
jgi:hypothetical protein